MRFRLFSRLLSAMIIVSLLPLAAVGYLLRQRINADLRSVAEQQLQLRLDKTSAEIQDYVAMHTAILQSLVGTPAISGMKLAEQTPALTSVAQAQKTFTLVFTVGPDGMNVARSDGGKLLSYADRKYVQDVLAGAPLANQIVISKTTGKPTLVLAVPVQQGGRTVGVLAATLDLQKVSDFVGTLKAGTTGYAWLVDAENKMMAHPDQEKVAKQAVMADHPAVQFARSQQTVGSTFVEDGRQWLSAQRQLPQGWALVVQMEEAEALAQIQQTDRLFAMIGVAALLIVILLAALLARNLTTPVQAMAGFVLSMAQGDFTQALGMRRSDEIGDMAEALRTMQQNLRQHFEGVKRSAQGVRSSAGELGAASDTAGRSQKAVAGAFADTIALVRDVTSKQQERVASARHSVTELVSAIEQVASSASHQAGEVNQASGVVENVSRQAEVVSGGIRLLAGATEQAASAAATGRSTVEAALAGIVTTRRSVTSAADTVRDLGNRSQAISTILDEISAIADQTNLLALNAAIEAARAGEAGRGFAVVADEIRKLADRSVRSAGEIQQILGAVQSGVQQAVAAMQTGTAAAEQGAERAGEAQEALGQILRAVEESLSEARTIQAAASELIDGYRTLGEATRTLAAVAEENSAAAEEMAAGSESVQSAVMDFDALAEQNFSAIQGIEGDLQNITTAIGTVAELVRKLESVSAGLEESVSAFRV